MCLPKFLPCWLLLWLPLGPCRSCSPSSRTHSLRLQSLKISIACLLCFWMHLERPKLDVCAPLFLSPLYIGSPRNELPRAVYTLMPLFPGTQAQIFGQNQSDWILLSTGTPPTSSQAVTGVATQEERRQAFDSPQFSLSASTSISSSSSSKVTPCLRKAKELSWFYL